MIRRHVLAALAVGVTARSEDAAREAVGRVDWVLRGLARRRLERALLDAALATGTLGREDPAAIRHLLQAAALIVRDGSLRRDAGLGRSEDHVLLADPGRVAAAYTARPEVRPLRLPIATFVTCLVALATATTVGAATVIAIQGPGGDAIYQRPPPPPPVGAFREGGAPRHDPAIEEVLAGELPQLVFASAQIAGRGALPGAARVQRLATLRDHPAFAGHGPRLAAAWRALIGSLADWLVLRSGDPGWELASRELRARTEVVTDQLAAAELGYYLEPSLVSDQLRRRTGLFTYRIENVAFVRANDQRIRVLDARRLDRLDSDAALLGLKAEELDDPVVLLDTVEAKVASQILPVLAGRAFPLGDDAWAASPRGRTAARMAGDAIRRELLSALYTDVSSIERAAARCGELIAGSVRHHEAQHRLDQDRGLAHPALLATRLGDRPSDPFAVRTRYELSAYLSQIASDVWLPQLTLWNLARHGFRRSQTRSAEAFVAVFALEGLARRLQIATAGSVLQNGQIDRDRLAALATALATRTTAELRSAAAAVWADLYGRPLIRLYD